MRIVWRFLAGAGILAGALLLVVAITVATLDTEQWSAPLRQRVKAETGRELVIGGGAGISISLNPKLSLRDVSLANAPWAGATPLLRARQVDLQIALLPLLRRQFHVLSLELVDPVIALETDAAGRGNWEFDVAPAADGKGAPDHPRLASVPSGQVTVTHGIVNYRDGRTGAVTRVGIDEFTLRAPDPKTAVATSFRGTVDGIAVAIDGTLGPLELLAERRWPYPVSVKGDVDGRSAGVATKLKPVPSGWSLDEAVIFFGDLRATGSIQRVAGPTRAKWIVDLALPVAAPGTSPPAARTGATEGQPQRWLFPESPLPLRRLAAADVEGTLRIDRLDFGASSLARLDGLQLRFALAGGRLAVPAFAGRALGGTVSGSMAIEGADREMPRVSAKVSGRELALAQVVALRGVTTGVGGGTLRLDADLASAGTSPRQWAAGVNGSLTLVSTAAKLNAGTRQGEAVFDRLMAAVDPFVSAQKVNELTCAVVRLPLANGVARIDRSIAAETPQVGVSARGTVDFANETLDLSFNVRPKRGLPVDLPQLAELVHLRGSFLKPAVGVDTRASVAAAARVGAAIGTAGLSSIGTALVARGMGDAGGECAVALGAPPADPRTREAAAQKSASSPSRNAVDEAGAALGRLLRR